MRYQILPVIFLSLFMSTVQAKQWTILAKWSMASKKDQTQELVWNSKHKMVQSMIQYDNRNPNKVYKVLPNRAKYLDKGFANEKQGLDYANGAYFAFAGNSIRIYSDTDDKGDISKLRTIKTVLPKVPAKSLTVDTDNKPFDKWKVWAGATDGNYVVKVAFASVTGNDIHDTKQYTHVFVYRLDSKNIASQRVPLQPIKSFRIPVTLSKKQYIQGAEVANGKVFIQYGGLLNSDDAHHNVILAYSLEGTFITSHRLDISKVIDIGTAEKLYPDYLKAEYEGLMVKNGLLYAQVHYKYGWASKTIKALIYEVFDTNKVPH